MTDRELMQEALYALTYVGDAKEIYSDTIESLRARLAQPEPEPVAQVRIAEDYHAHVFWMVSPLKLDQRYLYAAPRSWKGLMDEEYTTLMQQADHDAAKTGSVFQNLRHAIEAKLKEKNGF